MIFQREIDFAIGNVEPFRNGYVQYWWLEMTLKYRKYLIVSIVEMKLWMYFFQRLTNEIMWCNKNDIIYTILPRFWRLPYVLFPYFQFCNICEKSLLINSSTRSDFVCLLFSWHLSWMVLFAAAPLQSKFCCYIFITNNKI